MQKPDIILITCHDIGQHLHCYGVETVNSPNIDTLADEGVRFENSFCTAPQCSPSRAAIYTGRYPHNTGVMGLTHADFAWDMNPDEKHLCAILKDSGWQSYLVGCQHETANPPAMGYDEVIQTINGSNTCVNVAETACRFLTQRSESDVPFYLQIGFFEPHRPFDFGGIEPDRTHGVTVPEYLVEDEDCLTEFAEFQGAVKAVDAAVGRVLDCVKQQSFGENTIIIYTADHGIPFTKAKCTLYDAGIEVPFIIHWPQANWKPGTVHKPMISNVDYVPTILDLLGIEIPDNVQGRSFAGLLNGSEYTTNKYIFAEMTYHQYYDPIRCIRTERYKLIANFCCTPQLQDPNQNWRRRVITKEPKEPAWAYKKPFELYDMKADPHEMNDLYEQLKDNPKTNELKELLYKWMKDTQDPLLKGIPLSPMHHNVIRELCNRKQT